MPDREDRLSPAARRWQAAYFAACGAVVLAAAAFLWRPAPERREAFAASDPARPLPLAEPGDALPLTAELPRSEGGQTVLPVGDPPPLEQLLDRELPGATASERDVWRDVLDGLPLTDAREIVRLRERFGQGTPAWRAEPPAPVDLTAPSAPPRPQASRGRFADSVEALHAAADVHRHNIANADTLGFLPLRPVLEEAPAEGGVPGGVRLAGTELASAGEPPIDSAHDSDAAAPAGMFLAVRRGGERLLTTGGRLTRTAGGATLRGCEVVLDGEEPAVFRVPEPLSLEPAGNALYRPTAASGPAEQADAEAERGKRPPLLVDVRAERADLEGLLDRARLLAD